jgi:ABC-type sulfate transport system substrate-binding protein
VLVGWKDRTDKLFPAGTADVWASLHDALLKPNWGDASLGGDPNWGPVKFSHASPRTDTSGSDSLALLAYAYHKKSQLTPADITTTEFQSWLGEIEGRVSDFPASTDTLFGAFLARGPSAYDVVVAYENQAVARVGRAAQWGQLQVIYPSATMLSDHPFAILEASWVAPEQQEAARIFRDYLLGEPAQRLALRYGFRPANTAVSLNDSDPSNMFLNASTIGVRPELPGGVETPAPEVADALLQLWGQQTGR